MEIIEFRATKLPIYDFRLTIENLPLRQAQQALSAVEGSKIEERKSKISGPIVDCQLKIGNRQCQTCLP